MNIEENMDCGRDKMNHKRNKDLLEEYLIVCQISKRGKRMDFFLRNEFQELIVSSQN